jgi:alkylated DNA repair dioxygenase AlkB
VSVRSQANQLGLFDADRDPALPPGLAYQAEFLTRDEEARLLDRLRALPFTAVDFHGYRANRRTVSFGWEYTFAGERLSRARDIPDFLIPIRGRAAALAGIAPSALEHVLVTEYRPGTPIGWHRDKPVFGDVVGISLLSPCTFRLRKASGATWRRASFIAEPRSAYLLRGPARTEWEHSIPAVETLRYSVTLRSLRAP